MAMLVPLALAIALQSAGQGAKSPQPGPVQRIAPAAPAATTLAQVRELFRKLDLDQSSGLDAKEVAGQSVAPRDFAARDLDRDGKLSADEFVLLHRSQLVARSAPIAADVEAEASRLVRVLGEKGSVPAGPLQTPQATPRPRPADAKPAPEVNAKAQLEASIAEALRKASAAAADSPATPRAREVRPEREKVTAPVDTPRARVEPQPPAATPVAGPVAEAPDKVLDERAAAVEQALVERLRGSGATEPEIEAARDRLRKRVAGARERAGSEPAAASVEVPAPGDESEPAAEGEPFDPRARAALRALEERVRANGMDPERSRAARERLEQRIQNAKAPNTVPDAPQAPSVEPAPVPAPAARPSAPPAQPQPQPRPGPAQARRPAEAAHAKPAPAAGPVKPAEKPRGEAAPAPKPRPTPPPESAKPPARGAAQARAPEGARRNPPAVAQGGGKAPQPARPAPQARPVPAKAAPATPAPAAGAPVAAKPAAAKPNAAEASKGAVATPPKPAEASPAAPARDAAAPAKKKRKDKATEPEPTPPAPVPPPGTPPSGG